MKKIIALAGLVSALAFTSAAHASAVYNFSYTFSSTGNITTGSFTGDANGNLISNLSNISVSTNGTQLNGNGNLFGSHWTGANWVSGGAIVSFDGTQSNFLFIDSDFPVDSNFSNYFFSVPFDGGINTVLATDVAFAQDASAFNIQSWSVTQAASNVPEPGSIALIGLALAGLAARRRNRNS